MMSYQQRRYARSAGIYALATVATGIMLFPLLWIVMTSLRPLEDVVSARTRIIPETITLQAYVDMWGRAPILKYTLNSVVISATTALICLVFSALAAYGFVRFRFRGARVLLIFILISQSLPGASILLPLFKIVQGFGLVDTRQGLVFVYTGFITPFCTWLLIGYFSSIPRELEEAARVDGASSLEVLFRIVIPLSAPAIVAVGAFAFLSAWNEFLFAFILTREKATTMSVGIVTSYFSQYMSLWNEVAAAAIVFSLPPMLLFLLVQRQFISGLTAGAVKG